MMPNNIVPPEIYEEMWKVADKLAKKEAEEKDSLKDLEFIEERREFHLMNMLQQESFSDTE
jgi:hypothetical protein